MAAMTWPALNLSMLMELLLVGPTCQRLEMAIAWWPCMTARSSLLVQTILHPFIRMYWYLIQPTTHTPPGLQWATREEIQHAHYFIVTCTMAGLLSLQQAELDKQQLRCMTTPPTATNGKQVYISIFLICNFDLISIFLSFLLQLEACQRLTLPISMEQEPCHPQLAMGLTYKWMSSFINWAAACQAAPGVWWIKSYLKVSYGQSWWLYPRTLLAPTEQRNKWLLRIMELGRKKRE